MVNLLKFKSTPECKWFVVSDLHYQHEKLLESRGHKSIVDYNNEIITNWNNTVDNNSTVFMLGDTVLGAKEKTAETYLNLLKVLNYKELYVMAGNHHGFFRTKFNSLLEEGKMIDKYYRLTFNIENKIVHFIPNYYECVVSGQYICLSHYAILSWNNQKSSYLLFGHSHNSLEKTPWVKENYLKAKCLDVSWESYRRPISFDEVRAIMEQKKVITFDHH